MENYFLYAVIILSGYFSFSYRLLTRAAAFAGTAIALLIFYCFGFCGISLMAAFFILGSGATLFSIRKPIKNREKDSGRRNAAQVFANAGLAGIICLSYIILGEQNLLFPLMVAAVFASATADTLSSELGIIYGKKCYNIISFKRESPGADGLVSLEGSIFGIIGAALIASIFCLFTEWNYYFFWILISGIIGNLSDSVIGVLLQRKGLVDNDLTNFLNTVVAVLLMMVFWIS